MSQVQVKLLVNQMVDNRLLGCDRKDKYSDRHARSGRNFAVTFHTNGGGLVGRWGMSPNAENGGAGARGLPASGAARF